LRDVSWSCVACAVCHPGVQVSPLADRSASHAGLEAGWLGEIACSNWLAPQPASQPEATRSQKLDRTWNPSAFCTAPFIFLPPTLLCSQTQTRSAPPTDHHGVFQQDSAAQGFQLPWLWQTLSLSQWRLSSFT